jgi:hypothetical protein
MTIVSFHQQVAIDNSIPLLKSLAVLRNADALRDQIDSPSDQSFRHWFIWP